MGGFLSGIASIGSKLSGALNSPTGKGITDLAGRAGNGMAAMGGEEAAYQPQQEGLGGIRKNISDIRHPPMQVTPEHAMPHIGVGLPIGGPPPKLPFQPRQMPSFSPVNPVSPAGVSGPMNY